MTNKEFTSDELENLKTKIIQEFGKEKIEVIFDEMEQRFPGDFHYKKRLRQRLYGDD